MDKKTKKELERLQNLTNTEKNLMGGIYGDFFGDNSDPSAAQLLDYARQRQDSGADFRGIGQSRDFGAGSCSDGQRQTEGKDSCSIGQRQDAGERKSPGAAVEDTGSDTQNPAPPEPSSAERDPMEELDSLIGLTAIKKDVRELMDFVKIQKLRKDEGLKSVPVSLHLVFTGNPGTGKTTVARIIAKLYRKIGVLSGGQLVEVDRSGLVAGYVGQTALKTQEQIGKALGGVLFIDEAYSLAQKDDVFGQEAIDTILKAMEDHREDFVVIVAGYTEPMEKFINSNPGLKSRFNKYFEFPDYTIEELEKIFYRNCSQYDYIVEEEAGKQIRAMIVTRRMQRQDNFANAREIRNLFEDIITNQARRIAKMENPTHEDMMTITTSDLSEEGFSPSGDPQKSQVPEEIRFKQ